MKLERTPLPAPSAHDEVVRIVLARFGEKPLESDTYSVAPSAPIYDWLTSMFAENSFGVPNLPPNSSLLVFALDGDLSKAELMGARILITARFGEYPAFFEQGKTTSVFLLNDASVASTHNVWKHSSATRTIEIANFEDEDARFNVDPYLNEPYTLVPADAVLYVNFEGSEIKKTVVPVSKALIQFVLNADGPVFPIINKPLNRNESLFTRFSKWVEESLGVEGRPFDFVKPEDPYVPFHRDLPPDMQVPFIARMLSDITITPNDLIAHGVSVEALLLYYIECSLEDEHFDTTPLHTLYRAGARLSIRSLSHANEDAYFSIYGNNESRVRTGLHPLERGRALLNHDHAILNELCRFGSTSAALQDALKPLLPIDAESFEKLLREGVMLERRLRTFLELEVMGFPEMGKLAAGCIRYGERVRLNPARDMHLMATYAAHFDYLWGGITRMKRLRVMEKYNRDIEEAERLNLPALTEQLLATLLGAGESDVSLLLDGVTYSKTVALTMACRYNDKKLAKSLIRDCYIVDSLLASRMLESAPGRSMGEKLANRRKTRRTVEKMIFRNVEESARDLADGIRYNETPQHMNDFYELAMAPEDFAPDTPKFMLDLDFRYGEDRHPLLVALALLKPPHYIDKINLLLRYGANPWAKNKHGINFASFIHDGDEFEPSLLLIGEMLSDTNRLVEVIKDGLELATLAEGKYDIRGHYLSPPPMFTAIAEGNRSAVVQLLKIHGELVQFNGMSAVQYAMAMHPSLAELFHHESRLLSQDPSVFGSDVFCAAYCWTTPRIESAVWRSYFKSNAYAFSLASELGLLPVQARQKRELLEHAIHVFESRGHELMVQAGMVLTGTSIVIPSVMNAFVSARDPTIRAMHASMRRQFGYRLPHAHLGIEFKVSSKHISRYNLAVMATFTKGKCVKFWKLRDTDVDLYVERTNTAAIISDFVPELVKRRLLLLGCDTSGRFNNVSVMKVQHAGFRAMLISHFVPPPHAAIYNLSYSATHAVMRAEIAKWKVIYPVPYAVLGWINAAVRYDPSIARTSKRSSPHYMYFLARHPAVTAVLTWHMTLIDFAKAAIFAMKKNRLHPALFKTMRLLKHPLCRVADEYSHPAHSMVPAYFSEHEAKIVELLHAGDMFEFMPLLNDEFVHRGGGEPDFYTNMTTRNSMFLGDYVRTLLLMPDDATRKRLALDVLKAICATQSRLRPSWCLAIASSQLIDFASQPDARAMWDSVFVKDGDDFLSYEHFVQFHTKMLTGMEHIGMTAACAAMDFMPVSTFNEPLRFLVGANVNPTLRIALLSYETPAAFVAYKPVYTLRMFKPAIVRADTKLLQLRASLLYRRAAEDTRATHRQEAFDVYHDKYIIQREAHIERILEVDAEKDGEDMTHDTGLWLTRFFYMTDVAAYGPGKHLNLSNSCDIGMHKTVNLMRSVRVRDWDGMRRHAFELDHYFIPQGVDGLSLFTELARLGEKQALSDSEKSELSRVTKATLWTKQHLIAPSRDGMPFALTQITGLRSERLRVVHDGALAKLCALVMSDIMLSEGIAIEGFRGQIAGET